MPELDTIRGLAILGVLLYHGLYVGVPLHEFPRIERLLLMPLWLGRLGVNLFFVLSGFLITGILHDARNGSGYYRRFYVRRALRILPAYLALIAILAVTKSVPAPFLILSVFFLSNIAPLLSVPITYPVLWSLAVEEHFYLLWPYAMRKLRDRSLMWLCLAVITLSPMSRLVSFFLTSRQGSVKYILNDYTWNTLDGLACGALLALVLREYHPMRRQLLTLCNALVAAAIVFLLLGLPFGIMNRQTAVGVALQVVPWHLAFTALLGFCLLLGTGKWQRVVQIKSLRFFGEISFGLYLVHPLVFRLIDKAAMRYGVWATPVPSVPRYMVRFIVASSTAIFAAFLSRRYFEERFLRMKGRLS
jgi:peptidoglycan/LPS O-acetylase OafA/YrhL